MDIKVERIKRSRKYKGGILSMYADTVKLPNGQTAVWDFIKRHSGGAAAVIPVLPDGRILMVRQYRNSVDRITLEIPAGVLNDPKEPFAVCAARELEEETGYHCDEPKFLISIISAIGFCDEQVEVFVAEDLVPGERHLDPNEFVEIIPYELKDLCEMIYTGQIKDGKTVAAIMAYKSKYGL